MSKPVFGYWRLRGIAQPVRTLCAYAGVEIEEKFYELDAAGMDAWKEEKFNLGLDFPNLPYWKENGETLTESRAILKAVAREKAPELVPKDPVLLAKAEMIESLLFDVWFGLIRRVISDTPDMIANLENNISKKVEQLEKFVGSNKFVLGSEVSFVDFILHEVMYGFSKYQADYFQAYPNLRRFRETFESLPAIAEYIKSPSYILSPCFHPMYAKVKV